MVGFLVEIAAIGKDKVLGAHHVGMEDGRNHVGILESAVEDGNRDSFAFMADAVKIVAAKHLNLFLAITGGDAFDAVPDIEALVAVLFQHDGDRIGRFPDLLGFCDAWQGRHIGEQGGVVGTKEQGVVPSAGAYDFPFRVSALFLPEGFGSGLFYLSDIFRTDGEIGRIKGQPLFPPALDRLTRQPPARMIERVGGILLVYQGVAVDPVFASWILPHLGAGAACRRERQEEKHEKQYALCHNDCKGT